MRYDYLKRLADGTISMANENMERYHPDLRKEYPEAMGAQYLDGMMLAHVVQKEVLPLAQIDFNILIETVERVALEQLIDMHEVTTEHLETVAEILKSLKESTRGLEDE